MNPSLQLPEEGMTLEELGDFVANQMKRLNLVLKNIDGLNIVDIKFELQGGAYLQFNRKGIVINNGANNVFTVGIDGKVTMTGALIQSAESYPKIELNSGDNIFAVYQTEGDSVKLLPIYSSGPPAIVFEIAGAIKAALQPSATSFGITTSGTTNLSLQSAQDASLISVRDVVLESTRDTLLSPTGNLKINGFNGFTGTFNVVADVNFGSQTVDYTTVTVKKGIITDVSAV